jgi:flagellar protein FlaG
MQTAIAGMNPQRELPQDRARMVERRVAAVERLEASLPGKEKNADKKSVDIAATELEHISLAFNKKLKFVVDHESHEVIVKVIDAQTNKVVKILPPEELRRLHDTIKETIGFLFDERV